MSETRADRADPPRPRGGTAGPAAPEKAPLVGASPGLWGMVSQFMFRPPGRATSFEQPASPSAKDPEVNLPKNLSRVSFASECFSDGNYFDVGDSGSDAGDQSPISPRTP